MKRHINIKVFGKVQGVLFRETAKEEAKKLGLAGFVKNQPDGSVYIEAEGNQEALDKFLVWCNDGSERAEVEKIEVSYGTIKNFTGFERDFVDF